MSPAHIALFTYNRLEHTRRTVQALAKNELASQSHLHVFSDGPRTPADAPKVDAVASYLQGISGFKSLEVVQRPRNLGLANSIISGVTEICGKYGRVIVLEDDMLTSPYFLQFMNDALDAYEADPEVISVHAYLYPTQKPMPETFFIKGANCWGWATWSRGWELFNPDGRELLEELEARSLTGEFDFDGGYPYTAMLRQQIAGANDSWAVRWYASAFLRNKLTLYPGRSLVYNIGNDGSGYHCVPTEAFDVKLASRPINCARIPLAENAEDRREVANALRRLRNPREQTGFGRLKSLLKKCAPPIAWRLAKKLRANFASQSPRQGGKP